MPSTMRGVAGSPKDASTRLWTAQPAPPVCGPAYPESVSPTRTAAFFDLDKTIIAKSSTLAFGRPFYDGGLLNRRAVLRSAYANFVFSISGADHDQLEKMRAYLTQMVTGWDVGVVRQSVAETLHSIIDPLVFEEAVTLIEEHQAAGRDVIIVSASGVEVVEPIGAMLGVDHVIATTLVVDDGRYTGDVDFYAYGPNKAVAMRALAEERGYDLAGSYAYSDSETDVPMLEAVGHPYAVNPDKALRRLAEENGWPVLVFARPVAMRRRLGLDTRAGKAAATAVVASAIGFAAMAVVSRRRQVAGSRLRRLLVRL